jgi:hypothetical protein
MGSPMENVVPGSLHRLRAADIMRMAGLTAASQGQENCRIGAVQNTRRQGARISGIVHIPLTDATVSLESEDEEPRTPAYGRPYSVEVEIQSASAWESHCTCGAASSARICSHGAALLYHWLAHPEAFVTPGETSSYVAAQTIGSARGTAVPARGSARSMPEISPSLSLRTITVAQRAESLDSLEDVLSQMGVSELRGIAREYDIVTNGMSKQALARTILETMNRPEAVRRVATKLEKSQRQLLAALTLAGGAMTDEELRGLYERFGLGHPSQFQSAIVALQSKFLIFRTGLESSLQPRIGLSGQVSDIGWCVPEEVQTALRVTVPITTFNIEKSSDIALIQKAEPDSLLSDLLLIARALDNHRLTASDTWQARDAYGQLYDTAALSRPPLTFSPDGSVAIPPPADMPSPSLLETLQTVVSRSPTFLRFAVRLLRLADILHQDDSGTPYLRVLPNAAELLLGPGRADIAHELFELWLRQSSYDDLFDLQEEGLRLRCRATALNLPVLRGGELEAENSEARQFLLALLSEAPLEQWISFPAFARFVYRLNPLFLQRRQRFYSSPHWWIEREEGHPLHPLQQHDWLQSEVYYIARLLNGPLHWWGICDTAFSADGRLLAFRLTELAGWFFSHQPPNEEEPREQSAGTLTVTGPAEIRVACSPSMWPTIALLETFTESAGVRDGCLCYRLTPQALSAALGQGHRPAPLLELLRQIAAGETEADGPASRLATRLERWIDSYGRVRIYTGVALLEAADSMVMRELSATTSLDGQIVKAIHPTLLILNRPGAELVSDELKRRGQSPLLHDEEAYGTE